MLRLLRNRVFWAGVSIPLLLGVAVLIYGGVRGPSLHAAGVQAPAGDAIASSSASSISGLSTTPTVALPASLDNAVAAINHDPGPKVPSSLVSGSVDPSRAHLLISGANVSVYAAATGAGKVCLFATDGPAGCVDQFDASMPIAWMGVLASAGNSSNLVGLVPDDVRSVALQEGSATQQVSLQNNAFSVEPTAYPSAIIVTYDDGTSQSVDLGPELATGTSP